MALSRFLRDRRIAVLTGAGCSTDSGIPDYRGPGTQARARRPIQFRDFLAQDLGQARYWSRSMIGWPRIERAEPNTTHLAIAELQARYEVTGLVTQNVDRLHQKAGSEGVVELHGALAEVRCLDCEAVTSRAALQERLARDNPEFASNEGAIAPDGDADVEARRLREFRVPVCTACGGTLKPNVVFFGEGVPRSVVDAAWAVVRDADVLLVLGTSLTVFSGYRFVRGAAQAQQPIAIVTLGPTRGDRHATLKIDARLAEVMPRAISELDLTNRVPGA